MKRFLPFFLACLLIVPVRAASSSELRSELDRLKAQAQVLAEESAALEAELAENQSEIQTTIEKKSQADRRIRMTQQEIDNANSQMQQYRLLIAEKQSALEDAEDTHRELSEACKTRLRAMEESGPISYWSVLFRANSFSDLLDRINMIQEIAAADRAMLDRLSASAQQLEEDRESLRADLKEQELAKETLSALEAELQLQREAADRLLLELAREEDTLSEAYLAKTEEEQRLQQDIIAAQIAYDAARSAEEAARLAEANKHNAAGGGQTPGQTAASGFVSPLPAGAWITSAYGPRKHPLYGYDGFHTGIDLAANRGTAIYAIAAGSVVAADYQNINGNYVSLSHGGGYGSLYAHMDSCAVSAGDYVNQGDVIGYVGTTGWSSGPHLHFEIYVNGAAVNPASYIGF